MSDPKRNMIIRNVYLDTSSHVMYKDAWEKVENVSIEYEYFSKGNVSVSGVVELTFEEVENKNIIELNELVKWRVEKRIEEG